MRIFAGKSTAVVFFFFAGSLVVHEVLTCWGLWLRYLWIKPSALIVHILFVCIQTPVKPNSKQTTQRTHGGPLSCAALKRWPAYCWVTCGKQQKRGKTENIKFTHKYNNYKSNNTYKKTLQLYIHIQYNKIIQNISKTSSSVGSTFR